MPLSVGEATAAEVAEVLARLDEDEATLVVVSTDLSHYLDYDSARARDRATAHAILELAPERIGAHDACGRVPLNGLLERARTRGSPRASSTAATRATPPGPRDRVVGYGAYAFA